MERIVEEIKASKEEILLATRYTDNKVIDCLFKAQARGVRNKVIMAKENLEDKVNKLQLMLSPGMVMSLLEYLNDPDLDDLLRDGNVPFSFCIMDGKHCFFELPSMGNHDFSIAFFVDDEEIGERFTKMFDTLWESAEAKSVPKFFQMLSKIR